MAYMPLALLSQGVTDDDDEQADAKMRQDATAMLLSAIKRPVLPAVLLRTATCTRIDSVKGVRGCCQE